MTANVKVASATDQVLVITRVLNAPRDLVFQVWSRAEHLRHWFGPKDFTIPDVQADFQPGGAWHSRMRSPTGQEYRMGGVYRDIVQNERLIFTHAWIDADGKRGHETLITVTFAAEGNKTKLTFHQAMFETVSARDSHAEGWGECLDRLTAYIAAQA